jgi:23S rRNA pseudouridine2605 synthase
MINKPAGVLTATEDKRDKTVADLLPENFRKLGLFPAGRLDKDSEGFVLMTNDGDFMQRLLHPSGEVNKTYHVSVYGPIGGAAEKLAAITDLDGEKIRPAQVRVLKKTAQTAEFAITIHEGKNRQIRRMCAACGLSVKRLRRVQEHTLALGDLPVGRWRYLTEQEISDLKRE